MTSKRTGTKKRSNKRVKSKPTVWSIARRARKEATMLLKRNQAGIITRRALETGLEEIKADMTQLLVFKKALL